MEATMVYTVHSISRKNNCITTIELNVNTSVDQNSIILASNSQNKLEIYHSKTQLWIYLNFILI